MIGGRIRSLLPGLALAAGVAAVAGIVHVTEQVIWARPWLDRMAAAILIGAVIRLVWSPTGFWEDGLRFASQRLLEAAIVLLGASVSTAAVLAVGLRMPVLVVGLVAFGVGVGFVVGRTLGLSPRLSLLVACGTSICGNSAIVATAPLLEAPPEDVACAVACTAVLGVATVVGLPMIGALIHLDAVRYGVLTGLTVYAVPHVLAAAAPMGHSAVHLATLVKLSRVLMLGPLCVAITLVRRNLGQVPANPRWLGFFAPWFILGFLALAACRVTGFVAPQLLPRLSVAASLLTLVAMAALGLCSDLRAIARSGPRVALVASLSLALLGGASLLAAVGVPLR